MIACVMGHSAPAIAACLQCEPHRFRQVVASYSIGALGPAEGAGFDEPVGRVGGAGGFAAARAVAIHEPLEGKVHLVLHCLAKTTSMYGRHRNFPSAAAVV